MLSQNNGVGRGFFGSAAGWVFCAFVVIAAFFLIVEHRAHLGLIVPYLPLALVGLCVVLHSYMHGYAHDSSHESERRSQAEDDADSGHHHH